MVHHLSQAQDSLIGGGNASTLPIAVRMSILRQQVIEIVQVEELRSHDPSRHKSHKQVVK